MVRYSSRADKLQTARRELRSVYVGGLTLFTVLYVAVGLGLPYVQGIEPDWRVTPEVTGWYWIIGFGMNMVAAVLTWAVVAALSRREAEREPAEPKPLPSRRGDQGVVTRLMPALLSVSVVLFGFSLGVVTYYEWTWWQIEHAGRLWAAGAWAMVLGFVAGFSLLASGVIAGRREAREEAESAPAAVESAVEVAATMATALPASVPAQPAPAPAVVQPAPASAVALEPSLPALPPHRANPAAAIGRAFLIMVWIVLIATATWLEIRFEAEGSPFRYFALGGLAVVAILWWAAREALSGLRPQASGAVVRHRPAKPAKERPARPERPPRRRRFFMPESSLVKPIPVEPAKPAPVAVTKPAQIAAAKPVEEAYKPVPAQSVPERQPERPAEPAKVAEPAPAPAKVPKVGGQGRTWVGLDIGSRTIKVVQVAPGRPHPVVVNFASCPTPERSVKDSVIIKPTAVADAVTELLDKAGIKQRRVIAALGGQAVILRQAQFPVMPEAELREALKWESEQHIPIPADDAIVDFTILGEITGGVAAKAAAAQPGPGGPGPGGAQGQAQGQVVTGPAMQVLLVATQKRIVTGYTDVFEAAKLKPIALEVDLLGVHRALQSNGYIDDEGRPVAILNIGAASAGLSLFANHSAQLTRTIPAGSDVFTQSIAEAFQETPAAAETLLREHGAKPLTPIARCVEPVVDELVLEIRRSLEFYLIKNRQHGIGQLFMVGGAAVLPGLAQTISDALNEALRDKNPGGQPIEVIVPDPSRRLPVAGAARARLADFGPEYMQALGLALREESPH